MTWVIHTAAQGASNWLMSFRKTFKSSNTLGWFFFLCQAAVSSSSPPPHRCPHSTSTITSRHTNITEDTATRAPTNTHMLTNTGYCSDGHQSWRVKMEAGRHVKPRTHNSWIHQPVGTYMCVCIFILSKMTHFWAMSSHTYMHTLTIALLLTDAHLCATTHTNVYTQINTPPNAHSITDCNWQMSHSWQPIETRRDSAIVVTLVYWCLSIHLRAHVSVFRQMKREMEVWPLADCLAPSLCAISFILPLWFLTVFATLRLPFPHTFPTYSNLSASFPLDSFPSSLCHWHTLQSRVTAFLYSASLCREMQPLTTQCRSSCTILRERTNNLEKPITAGEILSSTVWSRGYFWKFIQKAAQTDFVIMKLPDCTCWCLGQEHLDM